MQYPDSCCRRDADTGISSGFACGGIPPPTGSSGAVLGRIECETPTKKSQMKRPWRHRHSVNDHARVRAGFRPSFDGRTDAVLQRLLADAPEALRAWPANCLRHGAISYALAVSRDIGKVATMAGNSPAVIARHYLELMKPSTAKAFFSIRPTAPANVRAFQPKAA